MTGTQLAALVRYKTGSNSTTFTDADALVLVNIFKNEIASLITERNQMYTVDYHIKKSDKRGEQGYFVIRNKVNGKKFILNL